MFYQKDLGRRESSLQRPQNQHHFQLGLTKIELLKYALDLAAGWILIFSLNFVHIFK